MITQLLLWPMANSQWQMVDALLQIIYKSILSTWQLARLGRKLTILDAIETAFGLQQFPTLSRIAFPVNGSCTFHFCLHFHLKRTRIAINFAAVRFFLFSYFTRSFSFLVFTQLKQKLARNEFTKFPLFALPSIDKLDFVCTSAFYLANTALSRPSQPSRLPSDNCRLCLEIVLTRDQSRRQKCI